MPDLEFRVLGTVEVWRGGEAVIFGRGAAINLLAGLLVSANTVVSTEKLADIAWSGRQPRHPRAAMHTKVRRLRRVLGEEAIATVGGGYRLQIDAGGLDLLRFNDLIAAAAGAPDVEAAATLEEATGLWRETPLSNSDSVLLQSDVVPRLVESYLAACEQWATVSLRLGRPRPVAERLAPLVAAHPFRESLTGLLMLARHRAARSADALAAYETLRRTLREELGAAPGTALQGLHMKILRSTAGEPASPPKAGRERPLWAGRGPSPAGLVGRENDKRTLARAVRGYHAVTVVGAAGVGKTELALHTAKGLAHGFADGVAVAELGAVPAQRTDDLEAVSAIVLAATNVSADPAQPGWEALQDGLQSRELLLVLDNAEHVWAACGRLVDLIARSCPRVRVITTSRRSLGFSGERVTSLAPLEPGPAAELLRLRAAEHGTDTELASDARAMTRLGQLLDGLPLALELAAARLRTIPLPTLIERIADRPDFLTVEGRPGLAHQRGLFDTLRWSYNLINEPSRLLLSRLTVFGGRFSMEDAERMCGAPPLAETEVAALLSDLADNSLVHMTDDRAGRCYRMLAPVREFAIGQVSADERHATRARRLRQLSASARRPDHPAA